MSDRDYNYLKFTEKENEFLEAIKLPVDFKIRNCTLRSGCSLKTLYTRAEREGFYLEEEITKNKQLETDLTKARKLLKEQKRFIVSIKDTFTDCIHEEGLKPDYEAVNKRIDELLTKLKGFEGSE